MISLPGSDGAMSYVSVPTSPPAACVHHPVSLLPGIHCQIRGVSEHHFLGCCVHRGVYLFWVTSLLLAPELAFISSLFSSYLVFLILVKMPYMYTVVLRNICVSYCVSYCVS